VSVRRRKLRKLAFNIHLKYIVPMRKLISIWVACTLLFITTMPTASLAAMCALSTTGSISIEEMASQQTMMHHSDMHKPMQMMHHTDAAMSGDWQTCRIECGCGCHQHMDSLPHVLSPHIVPQLASLPDNLSVGVSEAYSYSQIFYVSMVQIPPPDLS
jgi:hypothetical protein